MRRIFAATVLSVGMLVGLVDSFGCVGQGENDSSANPKAALSSDESVEHQLELGEAYEQKNDLEKAIQCYVKAIGLEPKNGQVQEALITVWSKALEENPLSPENHIGLGEAYQYRGDSGEARGEYRQALALVQNKKSGIGETAR
jgi:Flp pilus assembly protein TadD